MANKSAKKVRDHPDLEPGEQVIDACWGAGKGLLKMADISTIGGVPGQTNLSGQAEGATERPEGSAASVFDRNGILALTDRRVLFLGVKTAVRKPPAITGSWTFAEVVAVRWEKPMLLVDFPDGSTGGLYVGSMERPADLVAAAAEHLTPG
jgi:hypothetical protein